MANDVKVKGSGSRVVVVVVVVATVVVVVVNVVFEPITKWMANNFVCRL